MKTLQKFTRFNMASLRMGRFTRIICATAILSIGSTLDAQAVKSTAATQSHELNCTTPLGSGVFATLSWSLGGANIAPVNMGGGAGKPTVQNLIITKLFDECSAALFKTLMTGGRLHTLSLTQHDASTNAVIIKIDLQDAFIAGYELGGSTATPQPSEQVSMSYARIMITHVPSGAKSCWDVTRNMATCF